MKNDNIKNIKGREFQKTSNNRALNFFQVVFLSLETRNYKGTYTVSLMKT